MGLEERRMQGRFECTKVFSDIQQMPGQKYFGLREVKALRSDAGARGSSLVTPMAPLSSPTAKLVLWR